MRVSLHLYLTKKKNVEKSPSILLKRLRQRNFNNLRKEVEDRDTLKEMGEAEQEQLEGEEKQEEAEDTRDM